MKMFTVLGSAVLASSVLLVGCGDEQKAAEKQPEAPVVEQEAVAPSAMDTLKKEAGETLDAAGEVVKEADADAREMAGEMSEKASEMGEKLKEDAAQAYDQAEQDVRDLGEKAADKAADLEQQAREKIDSMQKDDEAENTL
ncbi:hypothetical protein [Marinobacterium marinum]|uniref:Late embryogenesis abundant protein n=1 Tax=Marinobacterium marinum TaxID=2756129 RepID=A0A7W1WYN4_9GAMM|nr:hypothetical protein [Marinobacterium marinum]MBA4502652.1 hypothetical protein [Marinobacterium marinum]